MMALRVEPVRFKFPHIVHLPFTFRSISKDLEMRANLIHGRMSRIEGQHVAAGDCKCRLNVMDFVDIFTRSAKDYAQSPPNENRAFRFSAIAIVLSSSHKRIVAGCFSPTGPLLPRS